MAKKLTIREQASLRWGKQAEIAVNGIHYRLLRSALTLGVVVLAVAFLTNILVENEIADACKQGVKTLSIRQRELSLLTVFIDSELDPRGLAEHVAGIPPGEWPVESLSPWLGMSAEALGRFQADCRSLLNHDAWLDEQAPGHRRLLAGKRDREETFDLLEDAEARRQFAQTARLIPLKLPAGFLDFSAGRRAFLGELAAAAKRFSAARAGFRSAIGEQPLAEWLAASDSARAAEIFRRQGLSVPPDRLETLLLRAREREQDRTLLGMLRAPGLAAQWRARFDQVFEQARALEKLAEDPGQAAWLAAQPAAAQAGNLDAQQVVGAANRILEARRLTEVEDRLLANYGDRPGLSANMFWLLVVSFMVCMAGITNAMLLSVIERFREIATMKCLGALDGFIAKLFLMEAAFLGLVGGLFGVLLGAAIGVARMAVAYGDWVGRFFPWSSLMVTAGIAVACGLVLTTLSALYPAWSAARMPPIEAMRVE